MFDIKDKFSYFKVEIWDNNLLYKRDNESGGTWIQKFIPKKEVLLLRIIKKNGTYQDFNDEKIIMAIGKSAERCNYKFSDDENKFVVGRVISELERMNCNEVTVPQIHNIVESTLDLKWPEIAKCYREYRNYKQDFVHMMDKVLESSKSIRYLGDKDNANTDSSLVATKRSLIYQKLNRELYQRFFLNKDEVEAIQDGYIYIHDLGARMDTINKICRV